MIKEQIKTYRDLNVYKVAYASAMEVFWLTKDFPKIEQYSLVDQIRRSSRSVSSNIGEGWAKRKYPNVFIRHLIDANGSCEETKIWLTFAKDCNYCKAEQCKKIINDYNQIGAMLNSLIKTWQAF